MMATDKINCILPISHD